MKIIDFIYRFFHRIIAVVLFLLLWEIVPRMEWVDPVFLPPFSKVLAVFVQMIVSGELFKHIAISLQRSLIGFGLGLAVAIPLGLMVGWFKRFENFIDPLLQSFRQTSAIALYPVFVLFFGIAEMSKVAIVFWAVQWAVLLNTISGVKNIDPLMIKAARSMGASQLTIFVKVVIPAAFPQILTGIRLSATASILVLVAAEMMGATRGLGFLLYDSQVKYKIPEMYVAILTMSLLGLIINYLLVMMEKKLTHWKEEMPTIA